MLLYKNEIWNDWQEELKYGLVNLFMYIFMY